MIEDMTIRKLAPRTQQTYIRIVKDLSAFLGASPAKASFDDIRRYQLHLISSGASATNINSRLTALRFLFLVTLRKPEAVTHLPFVRKPRKLPVVLSPEEVSRFLERHPASNTRRL
jgi:site-specific recombinase XerD